MKTIVARHHDIANSISFSRNILWVPCLTFSVRLIATKSEPGRRETPTLPWRGAMSTLHTFWRCRVQPSRWKNPSRFTLTKEGINKKNDRLAKVFFPWFMNISSQDPNFSKKDGHFARDFLWNFRILKQTVGVSKTVWNAYFRWLKSVCFARGRLRTFTKTNSQHRQQTPSKCTHNSTFHSPIKLLISIDFAWKKTALPSFQKKSITKNTLKGVFFSCFFPISFFQLHRGPQFHLSSDATQKV